MDRLELAWPLLVVVLAVGCESRVSLGERCVRDDDCASSLLCRLGTCRLDCLRDSDCGAAAHCVRVASGVGACTLAVEERCTTTVCPAPLVCREDRCQAGCSIDADCLASQRCDGTVCMASAATDAGPSDSGPRDAGGADAGPFLVMGRCADASDCEMDQVCADDFAFEVCRHACDSHDDCPASSVCDFYPGPGGAPIFGCSTVCRPGTAEGCPSGTTCRMAWRDSTHIVEGPENLSRCAPFDDRGLEGCACTDSTSGRQCAGGLLCAEDASGTSSTCVRICTDGDECAPGVPCEIEPGALILEGVVYGTCPPIAAPSDCPPVP